MPTVNPTPANTTPVASPKASEAVDPNVVVEATRAAASVGQPINNRSDLFNPNIVAKPLTSSTDPFFSLQPKNPDVVFRGINHCVMTKDGPNYKRLEQAKAQGYQFVTVADVQGTVPASLIREGRIMNGDLVLMKIDKNLYRGAVKWKDQQAIRATKAAGQVENTEAQIKKAAMETNMPGKLSRKLSPFAPSAAELKKDFGESGEE